MTTSSPRRPLPTPPVAPPFRAVHGYWLLAAVLVAMVLRGIGLGSWSLWIDEAHTFRDATMPLGGEEGFLRTDRAMYPLTFLILRGLLGLGMPIGEGWLRLPFALVGVVTVPLLAFAGRRLVGPTAAVVAAWLCAVDPWHVFWSQNARGYVVVFLCAALAADRFGRFVAGRRDRDLLFTAGWLGVGTLCHHTMLLQAAAFAAWLLGRYCVGAGRTGRLAVGCGVAAVVVWLPDLVAWMAPTQDFLSAKAAPDLLHFVQTTAYYYRPLLLGAAGTGLLVSWCQGERCRVGLLAALALVPFVVLALVGGQLVKATARYSLCAFPPVLWLAGLAIVELAGGATVRRGLPWAQRLVAGGMLAGFLLLDFGGQLFGYYGAQCGDRGPWREAVADVLARRRADRGLLILTVNEPTTWFYVDPTHWANPAGGDPGVQVHLLKGWELDGVRERRVDGEVVERVVLHEPGGRRHLAYWRQQARQARADLVVLVSRPELAEIDDGEVWPTLLRDFEMVRHAPCFVGPKDESIFTFVAEEP